MQKGTPWTKRAKLREQAKPIDQSSSSNNRSQSVTPLCSSDVQLPIAGDITVATTTTEVTPGLSVPISEDQGLVSTVLLTRIKVLETENARLKACLSDKATADFGVDQIKHHDH